MAPQVKTHCPRNHPYAGDNLYVWHGHRFCKACRQGRGAEWRETHEPWRLGYPHLRGERYALPLAVYKVMAACADCGYRANAVALDFDHVRGAKRFELSSAGSRSLASVIREIEKCDVVCSNCHRIRTVERIYACR